MFLRPSRNVPMGAPLMAEYVEMAMSLVRDPDEAGAILIDLETRADGVVSPVIAHIDREGRGVQNPLQRLGFPP